MNNTFSENAAGAAIMFSKDLVVRGNRFINNRGHRAYGLIFQSSDRSRLEQNEITRKRRRAFVQPMQRKRDRRQSRHAKLHRPAVRLELDGNRFTENIFARNLHPVETGGSDVSGNRWAVNGVGNFWDGGFELDLDRDGINDLPHRELDLFGVLRRDFPAVAFLSDSPALKLLRFANERAAIAGISSIEDPAPLTSHFWKIRAQRGGPCHTKDRGFAKRTMITTENLTKSYGRKLVLRGMSFCAAAERNHVAGRPERRRQKHDDEIACRIDPPE